MEDSIRVSNEGSSYVVISMIKGLGPPNALLPLRISGLNADFSKYTFHIEISIGPSDDDTFSRHIHRA